MIYPLELDEQTELFKVKTDYFTLFKMSTVSYETCPTSAPFFGFLGVSCALVFANIGAAYGTAKSGVGISSMGVMNPGAVIKVSSHIVIFVPSSLGRL